MINLESFLPEEAKGNPDVAKVYVDALFDELHRRRLASAAAADAEAFEVAQTVCHGVPVAGLGQQTLNMPAAAWAHYKQKERFDPGSRADRKTLLRLHPQFAVPTKPNPLKVGFTPEPKQDIALSGHLRERTVYPSARAGSSPAPAPESPKPPA